MTIKTSSILCDSPRSVTEKVVPWKAGMSATKALTSLKNPSSPNSIGSPSSSSSSTTLLSSRKHAVNNRRQLMNMMRMNSAILTPPYFSSCRDDDSRVNLTPSSRLYSSVSSSSSCRKSVSFSTMATVHIRPTPSGDDVANSWYNDQDYAGFERERHQTVHMLHTVHNGSITSLEQDGSHCVTGLEKTLTRRSALQRKYQTMQHSYAVLQQQFVNSQNGVYYDERSIQAVSEQYSKPSAADLAAYECQKYLAASQQRQRHVRHSDNLSGFLDQALSLSL